MFLASRREEIIERQYEEIKLLDSKYRTLYEESPVMLRTIDLEGVILDCNRAYTNNLGYSNKSEVIGHSIFEHTPDTALKLKLESFEQWKRTGIVKNKEVWFKRKDGTVFPALITANNLYDRDGKMVGSNTVITDATEIFAAREQLERVNKMREEFVKIASHELRSPVQAILLGSQLAVKNKMSHDKAWELVIREGERLKRLVEDILDVSRIEAGNLSYNMQRTRISEAISEVIRDLQLMADESQVKNGRRSIKIESIFHGETNNIELVFDRFRIVQALTNIITNSVKFTDGAVLVEMDYGTENKTYEIKVTDNGPGIHQEILPHLFNKFATRVAGENFAKQGTGLGLFISRSIIRAHGGDITAHNNVEGKGATFVITLPLK